MGAPVQRQQVGKVPWKQKRENYNKQTARTTKSKTDLLSAENVTDISEVGDRDQTISAEMTQPCKLCGLWASV